MSDEIELGSFHTCVSLSDTFFSYQHNKDDYYLLPAIKSLINACDGLINEPGMYTFKLTLYKLK